MKYVRAATAGIVAALAMWLIGMFLVWDAYGFWQTGKSTFEGSAMTRVAMLWGFVAGASVWLAVREDRA